MQACDESTTHQLRSRTLVLTTPLGHSFILDSSSTLVSTIPDSTYDTFAPGNVQLTLTQLHLTRSTRNTNLQIKPAHLNQDA